MKGIRWRKVVAQAASCVLGLLCVNACSAQRADLPEGWRVECVGRAEVSLPGDSEVAVFSEQKLNQVLQIVDKSERPFFSHFPDGQVADYDNLTIAGGVFVTAAIDDVTYVELQRQAQKQRAHAEEWAKKNPRMENGQKREFSSPSTISPGAIVSKVNASYVMLRRVGKSALLWKSYSNVDVKDSTAGFLAIDHAVPRSLYELPSQIGVCAPYFFAPDDGTLRREIAVTYRPKSHPDITIWIDDSNGSGGPPSPDMNPDKQTAKYDNEFFWSQNYQQRRDFRYAWHGAKTIDGIKGYATEVELRREDGTIDFGYYAAALGDYREPGSSDYRMFVIRDAANAKAKGIKPMSHDEFIALAHTVVGSLKRRVVEPVQAPK